MQILLYTPRVPRQSIQMDYLISCEPLELEYLYTVLKDDHHVSFLVKGDKQALLKQLSREVFQMLCISCYITQTSYVLALSEILKEKFPNLYIAVGGVHAEVVPEHFFSPFIDAVIFGNHLDAISQIAATLESGTIPVHIEGVAFKTTGFVKKPMRKPIHTLPPPDRVLFNANPEHYFYFHYSACATVKTAFSCTGKCTFCFCRKMNAGVYFARPVPEVVTEISNLKAENVFILDDNFLIDKKRLISFCEELENRQIRKKFIAYGTSDFIAKNSDIINRLHKNGLSALIVGFEYISDQDLKAVNKKGRAIDHDLTVKICNELGVELFALFICNPDWKHSDFLTLARYVRKRNIPFATFSTPTVLPNTDDAIQQKTRFDLKKTWRYDLLRLHQEPKYISRFSYYLWLYILYLIPIYKISTLKHLFRKYGWIKGVKVSLTGAYSGALYFIKIFIWK